MPPEELFARGRVVYHAQPLGLVVAETRVRGPAPLLSSTLKGSVAGSLCVCVCVGSWVGWAMPLPAFAGARNAC